MPWAACGPQAAIAHPCSRRCISEKWGVFFVFAFFSFFSPQIVPTSEIFTTYTDHLQILREDRKRIFKDIIETTPPKWIIDMVNVYV